MNRMKNENRTQLPMRGNLMASCLVIASVLPCATGLMDRYAPAYTANVAVARMLALGSIAVTAAQHTWSNTSAMWAIGAAMWVASSISAAAFAVAERVPAMTLLVLSNNGSGSLIIGRGLLCRRSLPKFRHLGAGVAQAPGAEAVIRAVRVRTAPRSPWISRASRVR